MKPAYSIFISALLVLNASASADPCPCPGDLDGNGRVDGADVEVFTACYARGHVCPCANMDHCGEININDVQLFVEAVLRTTPVCDPLPAPITPVSSNLPPSSFLATSESALRYAAEVSLTQSINVLIDRKITVDSLVRFPTSDSVVRLIGVTPEAEIEFNMTFVGFDNIETTSGLSFHCRQATVYGMTFSGFETLGAAIKGHTTELLDISNCIFRDIGTIQFPLEEIPASLLNDNVVYNQCIAAHDMLNGHISITNCTFINCALNNWSWSHCVYVSARSVRVANNLFDGCGSTFAVGDNIGGASNNIFANRVRNPAAVMDRYGVVRQTYLCRLGFADHTAFMFNTIAGEFDKPWSGSMSPATNLIEFNNYNAMRYTTHWAVTSPAVSTWEEWMTAGFDNHRLNRTECFP